MGKDVSAVAGRIAPRPTAIADCVARWVRLATKPCTRNAVRRILGRLVWPGRPGNTAPFLAKHASVGAQGAQVGAPYAAGHDGRNIGGPPWRRRGADGNRHALQTPFREHRSYTWTRRRPMGSVHGAPVGARGTPYPALPDLGDQPAEHGVVGSGGGHG